MQNFFQRIQWPKIPKRWTEERKLEVYNLIRSGLGTWDEVCMHYGISHEEMLGLARRVSAGGERPDVRVKSVQTTPHNLRANLPPPTFVG